MNFSFLLAFILFACLNYLSAKVISGIRNVNFFDDYYFILSSSANESFGFSMTPYEKDGTISLMVGAPRSSNNLPAKTGIWLGGLFECGLDRLDCGMNQIVNLDLRDWSLSNFGFSLASAGTAAGGSTIAACDPRARLSSPRDLAEVEGVGLCFLLRPDLRSPGDLRQGAVTFMPSLIRQGRTPMPNMLFGTSVAALPAGDAYAFGFPYLLLGFGGTVFMSTFNASLLSTTGSQSVDSSLRRHPVTFWGHSYTGGFDAMYADLRQKPNSHVTKLAQAQEDRFYQRLKDNRVRSYSCAGFSVATSNRLFGSGGNSGGFDLAEGAPCPPEPLIHPVSFTPDFAAAYRDSFATDAEAASNSSGNGGFFTGLVRLYAVAGASSSLDICRREVGFTDSRWYDSVNCFPDSGLRASLQGPGGFASRFGHALLLLDLNADGWDDLIVSAPADLSVRRADGAYWTVGAVYVYMNGGAGKFIADRASPSYRLSFPSCEALADSSQSSQLGRLCSSARQFELRFGWSLARLGDVDRDGFEDFAVGAPLAGSGGGAVVVFKGGRDGAPRLGQIVANADAAGFGEAVSPGADFDASGRADLVVAAPRQANGKVYFYPARYVVRFDIEPLGSQPDRIPRDRPNSLVLRFRLSKTVLGPALDPGSRLSYSIRVQFFVDTWRGLSKPRFRPLNLGPNNTLTVTEATAEEFALTLAYDQSLLGDEADLTSPVQLEAVWLAVPSSPGRPGAVPKAAKSALLAAPHVEGLRYVEGEKFPLQNVSWNHGCSGPRCLSQLSVTCQSNASRDSASGEPELLIAGDADSALEILCQIDSTREPAYNAYLRLQFDSAALALTAAWVRSGDAAEFRAVAALPSNGKLMLGNPMAGETAVRLLFKPVSVRCDVAGVRFQFTALTSSDLAPSSSPVWETQLRLRTELSISMQAEFSASLGYQNQTLLGFNAFQGSLYKLTSPRRLPELYITLANQAAAYLPSSYLLIHWPIETAPLPGETNGKYLMYLQTLPYVRHAGTDRPRTSVTCNAAQLAAIRNPLRLKPDDIDSCRQAGQNLGDYSAVNVSESVRLPDAQLPPPLKANRTNPGASCSRQSRFDFTYSCANSRCLPLLCRLGELSTRTEPLQLTFATVAYQFTFIEDNLLCSSVSIVPSVQWLPGPEFADRVAIRSADQVALNPVLQSFNSGKPPPEEMDLLMRILIYAGASLLGAIILGLLILVLATCTPFFKRQRNQRQKAAAPGADLGGGAGLKLSGNGGGARPLAAASETGTLMQGRYSVQTRSENR